MPQHPLLQTKLYIPRNRSELVPRPRLLDRLQEGLKGRLTLISAPAGFGKTTLLSDWLREVKRPVAWLSLDDGDNDPIRFLAYLIAALQGLNPNIGQTAQAMLQAPQASPPEPLLTTLINDIAATAEPFILVLDDYHVIEAVPVHEVLSFLLDRLPPSEQGVHLVIATRADPPLPIARLRARGQLAELHVADLRFGPDEALAFLNEVMGLSLAAGQIAALERRTEGWIAGLQLAALSMQGREDVSEFIETFTGSHRYVLDYLTEEVLNGQSDDVRAFLLQTAILERLTGPLCDQVTERTDSHSVLEWLEAANLFTIRLDDERRWYRYHRLFADLLRQRLQREMPEIVPELHHRASAWYRQEGLVPGAVGHLLAAGDFEQAAPLVEEAAWPMLARGEMTTLLGWLGALPDDVVFARSRLVVVHAWALALTGQFDGVEPRLVGVDLEPVRGEVAALRAYVADFVGDPEVATEYCHQALSLLPEENLFLRSIMTVILGTGAYLSAGDSMASLRVLNEAATLGQASGNVHLDVTATCTLGFVQMLRGQLHLAVEIFDRAFEIGMAGGKLLTLFVGLAHAGMAEILYEWNDLDGAVRHSEEGIALGERGESVDVLGVGYSYVTLAQLHQAQGDEAKALRALQKGEQLARRCNQTHVSAVVAASRARLWLAQGSLAEASRWARAVCSTPSDEPEHRRLLEKIGVSRVRIAEGNPGEALDLLARLREVAEVMGRMDHLLQILNVQALAYQALGNGDQALSILQRALFLAEPEGYVRTFVDEGEPMARLLRRALTEGIAPSYVGKLVSAFRASAPTAPPAAQIPAGQPMVDPLTGRELQVLRLIAAGLSNREIAGELVVAVSTVKTHINHIYGKLDVKSRIQAVAKAQELGLL